MRFSTSIFAIAGFVATASALGINCRGSSNCFGEAACNLDRLLSDHIYTLSDDAQYGPGQHIGCCDKICAFTQKTSQWTSGKQIKYYASLLQEHQCNTCGSVPFDGKNVNNGEFTVNWVF